MRRRPAITVMSMIIAFCMAVACASGSVLINGDFEASPFDLGWDNWGGHLHSGLVAGSNQSTAVNAPVNEMAQSFDAIGPEWSVEFLVAVLDPSPYPASNRCFNLLLTDRAGGWLLNIRVANDGSIQCYDGVNWRNAGAGGEIKFSTDAGSDGDFSDPDDTLNVYRIRIAGRKWGSPQARYDILASAANSDALTSVGTDLAFFQKVPDALGDQLDEIIFRTSYGMVDGQFYVVDNCLVERNDSIVTEQTQGATMVSEEGPTSDSFSVVIKRPLTASVTVNISQTDGPPQLNIEPQTLVFSPRDEVRSRTVTVTAIDDAIEEDDPHYVSLGFDVSSSDPFFDKYPLGNVSVGIYENDFEKDYPSFSGIYPHLAVTNGTYSEVGIGAVVSWADSLWFVTYSAHNPLGSDDGLYQVHPDMHMTRRPESVGGTPANRMIHDESQQLVIGPYLIDGQGNVRTIPYATMPGRMTATARDLTDPADKVYFITMEEGLYEVDVHTLAVTTLHQDRNVGGGDLLPGEHGKGGYTGQGRLILANNGNGGVLAEWDGAGDPGQPASWTIVDRNKYTDITGPGGIHGSPDANAPVWAIGWDDKSVLLNVCDNGGIWKRFRLPKASYTQDADHGWYTEWPRIRRAGSGQLLMDMHCMFYEFPSTFSHSRMGGIRPLGTHLKMFVDWDEFGGRLVFGCDDASVFDNPLLGRAQSNLWFGSPDELSNLGRAEGWGGVWLDEPVQADTPSEPYLIAGFDHVVVHLAVADSSPVDVDVEIDADGTGTWTQLATVHVPANGYAYYILPEHTEGQWLRFRTDRSVARATAYLHSRCDHQVLAPKLFKSLPQASKPFPCSIGLLRPADDEDLPLQFSADIFDSMGNVTGHRFYVVSKDMHINPVDDPIADSKLRNDSATTKDFEVDDASVIMVDDRGRRLRLPKGDDSFDDPTISGWPRGIREVVTERSLMNIYGTIYELPRYDSGGLRKIRPITTHNRLIYDFCSWRGMLVIAGNLTDAEGDGHYIRSEDGLAGLWFGSVDDLFKLGVPRGTGGPWKNTAVEAGHPSDPYLMTGYDKKVVELSHDLSYDVVFTIEVDFLGDGSWYKYGDFRVHPGQTFTHRFPDGYSAHWVRVTTDRSCIATAWFRYNQPCDGAGGAADLACLAHQWLRQECGPCDGADLNSDAVVDFEDLAVMAGRWLITL